MTERPPAQVPRAKFSPDALAASSAAEQIADQLRRAMIEGSLRPGDRLPSEPELAEGFGVSRPTVREAMKILRGQGILETSRGAKGGHYIRRPEASAIAESLGETYCLWFDIGDVTVAGVDEAREVVERACVRFAAMRRSEDDLTEMRRILDEASSPDITADEFQELEVAFHRTIADAARNRLLNLPMQAIHIVRPRTNKLLQNFDREPILAQHTALYDGIESGDPDIAEKAFDAHLLHLADLRARVAQAKGIDTSVPLSDIAGTSA